MFDNKKTLTKELTSKRTYWPNKNSPKTLCLCNSLTGERKRKEEDGQ